MSGNPYSQDDQLEPDRSSSSEEVKFPAVRNLRPIPQFDNITARYLTVRREPWEKTLETLLSRVDAQQKNLESITQSLTRHKSSDQSPDSQLANLTNRAETTINEAVQTLRQLAGIQLPEDRGELYVKATAVYQLQEYHEDESCFMALATLSAGAALGVLVNWATSQSATLGKSGWIALLLFALMAVAFAILWWRARRRANRITVVLQILQISEFRWQK